MDWIEIGPGFWNLRGSFTFAAGLIDIGTHCSLIKLRSGKFLLIDTIAFSDKALRELNELTTNGIQIEAVIATHPFHTMYFPPFAKKFPGLRYIGTPRHIKKGMGVTWEDSVLNHLHDWENDGVYMRIPDGADFENPAENNHFSSVHVFHSESRTIHIDDTILYFDNPPCVLSCLGKKHGTMEFWDLNGGLQEKEAAAAQFKAWVQKFIEDWDFDNICTAHTGNLIGGAKAKVQELLVSSQTKFDACARKHHGKV